MSNSFSKRLARVQPSATLAVSAEAGRLKREGKDIISLSAGEPDFDTPKSICDAAKRAIDQGQTRYTAASGTLELKQAICDKFLRDNQLSYQPEHIVVSTGAKQSLFNAFMALLNDGDEVLIPAPYWVSYPDMVKIADGVPVIIKTDSASDYKITAKQLESHISERTKCVVINSPSNPTGVSYSRSELEALADVLKKYPKVWIISDDIYEHIYWGDTSFCNMAMIDDALSDRCVVINGVSKAYAMTGWRIGYAASVASLAKQMSKLQSQSTSNPCSIAQAAALEAISGAQDSIRSMGQIFRRRHDFVVEKIANIPLISVRPATGAFYLFIDAQSLIERMADINDDIELAKQLLNDAGLAFVPGSAFGAPGHLRMSFALADAELEKAIDRLEKFTRQFA